MTRDTDDFFSDPFDGRHSSSSSSFSRQHNSSSSSGSSGFGFPRGFFDDDRDMNSGSSRSHHFRRRIVEDDDSDNIGGGKTYSKTVAIGRDINPDDVKITLKDFVMTVEVKTSGHELMNKFTIPRNVDKSKLKSTWTPEGNLKIDAPFLEKEQQQSQVERRKFFDNDSSSSDFFGSSIGERQNNPGKYEVSVPIGKHVDPQNLKVTVKDNVMTVEAKIEKKSEDETSKLSQSQAFKQSFTVPPNVNTDELISTWTKEGVLKIEAPMTTEKKRQ